MDLEKKAKKLLVLAMGIFVLGMVCPILILKLTSGSLGNSAKANEMKSLDGRLIFADKYSDKVKETEKKKNEAQAKKNKLEAETKQLQREADEILQYMSVMDQKQSETMIEMEKTQEELDRVTEEYNQASAELVVAEQNLATQYESMKKRVQYIYENGQMDEIAMFVKSKSVSDILNAAEYIDRINVYDHQLLVDYAALKDEVAERKLMLGLQIEQIEITKEMYEADYAYCQEIISAKQEAFAKYEDAIGANEEILEEYIVELANAQKDYNQAVAEQKAYIKQQEEIRRKQQEEERRKQMELAAKQITVPVYDNAKNIPQTKETNINNMIWPLPGDTRVGSKFGPRVPPCAGASSFHQGWDIGGKQGAQVVAVLAGRVTEAGYNNTCGNHVYIDHGNGYSTHYLHFSVIKVSKGDYVQQGQIVGLVGSTGVSTAPHLHFALYKNGKAIDPAPYLKR